MKALIAVLTIAIAGCGQDSPSQSGRQPVDKSSAEFRYARERTDIESLRQNGKLLSPSDADKVAEVVVQSVKAQQRTREQKRSR